MIVARHIVFGAYGFWLPNDPRGSWSTFVGSNALFYAGGPATKTDNPNSLARAPHDRNERLRTKKSLQREPVRFTGIQARAIGNGLGAYFTHSTCKAWACAILPDHVHLVVGTIPMSTDQFVVQLKGAAVKRMTADDCHPFADEIDAGHKAKCFVRGYWVRFVAPDGVADAIDYVEENPMKLGLRRQRWSFVSKASF